ncbi:regulator of cell cycle RGCC-like [Discoglossus pictus]
MDRQGEDLALTLREFDEALHDFFKGPCESEERLKQLKMRLLTSSDSGISDTESFTSSKASSRSTSEVNLTHCTPNAGPQTKAKLGDTRELEDFIANLDKVLNDM